VYLVAKPEEDVDASWYLKYAEWDSKVGWKDLG